MKKSLLMVLGLSANLFLSGCADDQARQQIADTNQRLTQVQQNVGVLDNKVSNQKLLDMLNQITDLQSQINDLNGRVATLEHGQKSGQSGQGQQFTSFDLRLQALESTVNNGSLTPGNSAVAAKQASSATRELQAAVRKIKANDPSAIPDLKNLMASSPDKTVAANASYFLAVAYIATAKYKDSISEASNFIVANGNSKYVPDALRVIYIAQSQLNDTAAATATAQRLLKSFPKSEAAKKVAKQMQQ